ncbi:MAG: glutamate mutase L, partial [Aggregatilineales bacterium]
MEQKQAGSVLAVDFGSVTTRVLLIDVVDGQYRLVARSSGRTTIGYPVDDVSVGLYRIVQDISDTSGRRFYNDDNTIITPEAIDRSGVDYFITTASAGRPLRAVVVGLLPDISVLSALRAISDTYVESATTIHLMDGRNEEQRLNAILSSYPDVIFVAGGTERGAEDALKKLLKTVHLAIQVTNENLRPDVIYAGNTRLAAHVHDLFDDLTGVFIAENIRPDMRDEHFESANVQLGRAYDEYKERNNESFHRIAQMSSTGVLPTAQSYHRIAEYYAHTLNKGRGNVMAIDAGSAMSVVVAAFGKHVDTSIGTDIGVGLSAEKMLGAVGASAIQNWLPFEPHRGEIRNYALNKSLRPATVPMTLRDLYLEHALLRAGLCHIINMNAPSWHNIESAGDIPDLDMILAGGSSLTATGHPAFNVLLMLDILQPTGITAIKADPHGLIAALGGMAQVVPEAVVQLLDSDNLEHAGTVISVSGQPEKDQTALTVKITTNDETITTDIPGGHLVQLPITADETLKLDIRTKGNLRIGGKRRIKTTIKGGTAAGDALDAYEKRTGKKVVSSDNFKEQIKEAKKQKKL